MEPEKDEQIKRKGSMLEDLAEMIFKSAGFEVIRNRYFVGYEIDLMVTFGDRNFIIECKQYEKSYLPVKNLILQWKGKNEIINADGVILIIYGVNITEDEKTLAQSCGIHIWTDERLNSFLRLINDDVALLSEVLKVLELKEKDIAERNERTLKELIWRAVLSNKREVAEEDTYGFFRKALRRRIITNLKEFGSTPQVREKHFHFFENVIKETETKKFLIIFKEKLKLSEKSIWEDIKIKIKELKPFDEETNNKYLAYMESMERGFIEYTKWFYNPLEDFHRKLIFERISSMQAGENALFYSDQQKIEQQSISFKNWQIILPESVIKDLKILEWILTDLDYQIVKETDQSGKIPGRYIYWNPANLEEATDYIVRIFYEYFGVKPEHKLLDKSLISGAFKP